MYTVYSFENDLTDKWYVETSFLLDQLVMYYYTTIFLVGILFNIVMIIAVITMAVVL